MSVKEATSLAVQAFRKGSKPAPQDGTKPPEGANWLLYHAENRCMLRGDLSLSDYAGLRSGHCLWLVRGPPPLPESRSSPATDEKAPQPSAEGGESAGGAPLAASCAPPARFPSSLAEALGRTDKLDVSAGEPTAVPPEQVALALAGATSTSHPESAVHESLCPMDAALPGALRSFGRLGGHGGEAPHSAEEVANAVPASLRAGLVPPAPLHGYLSSLGAMPLVPDAALLAELAEQQRRQTVAHARTLPDEELEERCARIVDSLAPVSAPSGGAGSSTAGGTSASTKSVEGFGSGLKKGFLSARPKRRRVKPAAPPKQRAVEAEAAAEAAEAAPTTAPAAPTAEKTAAVVDAALPAKVQRAACAGCSRRLTLAAAVQSRCRCGSLFCARCLHEHACGFDYRAPQRDKLERANPKVSPDKLDKLC